MAYVIQQLILWLLLTAVAAGVAGWAFHKMRNAMALDALEKQRDDLRKDLLGFVDGSSGGSGGLVEHERETDMLRTRNDLADSRIVALEKSLEEARSAREEALTRVGELERAAGSADDNAAELDRLRTLTAEAETRRAAELEVEAEPAPDAQALRWRMRYLESRVKYLEGITAGADDLAAKLAAAETRAAHLEANAERASAEAIEHIAEPTPAPSEDALNPLRWQARYLQARVGYLESAANTPSGIAALAAEPSADEAEVEQRRRWRMRYLETRLGHIEEVTSDASEAWAANRAALEARAQALEAALAARNEDALDSAVTNARVEELETLLSDRNTQADELNEAFVARGQRIAELEPLAAMGERARRLTWRARYAEARVRQLEAALSEPAAPQPVAAPVEPAPPQPLVPPGQEVRPRALPAARNGAPDDFTLIEGLTPLQQTTLNSLGFYHYDQIAAWTPANVAWVDQYLRLKGRISEERWVEQAAALISGLPRAAE
jgi:predicted flap endonuclease-1-like 5' DNA nuclease